MQTGHNQTNSTTTLRAALTLCATALSLLAFSPSALAAPNHPRLAAQDITGLNHACGAAVDSQGDLYASSAGESKIKLFNPAHTELTSITNSNEPCGLAVDSKGNLYVSEAKTGNVVKYVPNAYPFAGTPTYGAPTTIDASGEAQGISVDPTNNRLYVAESNRIGTYDSNGKLGIDEVQRVLVIGATGGTFTLSFKGQKTGSLKWDASHAEVQAALEALGTIGAGNVSVTEGGPSWEGRDHMITFTGALASTDVAAIEGDSSGLTGGGSLFIPSSSACEACTEGFDGQIGKGELGEATGVAAYTYGSDVFTTSHYLFVAGVGSPDAVKILSTQGDVGSFKPRRTIESADGQPFSFGAAGTAVGLDSSNGHFYVYDAGHKALDEFEASGELIDQTTSASFADPEPGAIAVYPNRGEVQRLKIEASGGTFKLEFGGEATAAISVGSIKEKPKAKEVQTALEAVPAIGAGNIAVHGTYNGAFHTGEYTIAFIGTLGGSDVGQLAPQTGSLTGTPHTATVTTATPGSGPGRLDVGVGGGSGAKLATFGPLAEPGRSPLPGLSQTLEGIHEAAAVDSYGDVYVANSAAIKVFFPGGKEIKVGPEGKGIPAEHIRDLEVDSEGNVYGLDGDEATVKLFAPGAYPPADGTKYGAPSTVATQATLESGIAGIGLDPANDHLFVTASPRTVELASAAEGSAVVNKNFAPFSIERRDVAICGSSGDVYFGGNGTLAVVNPTGTEVLAKMNGAGSPGDTLAFLNERIAVDQSDCHVLFAQAKRGEVEEFEPFGAFVAGFYPLIEGIGWGGVAVDNGEHSPNRGDVYVAYNETAPGSYDLAAFGPLSYGEEESTPEFALTVSKTGTGQGTVTSSPAGIKCGEDCSEVYAEATVVTLEAKADAGSTFTGWSGSGCSGTANCKVTMTEAKAVTAEFTKEETGPVFHKLTITVTGNGSVSANTGTISGCTSAGGSSCEGEYEQGAKVTLTETPGEGSLFNGWQTLQCDESTASTCEVTIGSGDEGVAASFQAAQTLKVSIEGEGTITSSPGLISCSPFCEDSFAQGTKVTLTATPTPGSIFLAWKHCDSGGVIGGHCTVTMDKAKTVTAVFASGHALTVKSSGLGKVQSYPAGISCLYGCLSTSAVYNATTKVTLKATPARHFHFAGFSGDCEGTGACEVAMGQDREVKALFTRNTAYALTLTRTGAGKGIVKSHPAGINCGYTCISVTASYDEGEEVLLEVSKVALGSAFGGWSGGGCSGTAPTCVVAISEAKEVKAEFK
jgi:hypothetical protein